MEYLLETYDEVGKPIYVAFYPNPIKALEEVAINSEITNSFLFKNATCYLNGVPQWELEIK